MLLVWWRRKLIQDFKGGNVEEMNNKEDLGIDGNILFKMILKVIGDRGLVSSSLEQGCVVGC